jgi:hypothetical protein
MKTAKENIVCPYLMEIFSAIKIALACNVAPAKQHTNFQASQMPLMCLAGKL